MRNPLRSALTTLGIVIGVTAVIVLVGLGQGMKAGFNKSFGELATAITVDKIQGSVPGGGPARDLRDSDVTALADKKAAPAIGSVIPVVIGEGIVACDGRLHGADVGDILGSVALPLG